METVLEYNNRALRIPVTPQYPTGVSCDRCGNELSRDSGPSNVAMGVHDVLGPMCVYCPRCGMNHLLYRQEPAEDQ